MHFHRLVASALDSAHAKIRSIQSAARGLADEGPPRPLWPMMVFRTPKGWTGPKFVDRHKLHVWDHGEGMPEVANWRWAG